MYTKRVAQCPACGLVQPSGVCCMDCGRMLEVPGKPMRSASGTGADPLASIEDELRRMSQPQPRRVEGTSIEVRTGDVVAWESGPETEVQQGDDFMDPTSLDLGQEAPPTGDYLDETEQERPNPLPPEDIAVLAQSLINEDDTAEVKASGLGPVPSISVSTESLHRPELARKESQSDRSPRRPPTPRPRVPSPRAEAARRPQFWDAFAGAFVLPFVGKGIGWLVLLFGCCFASQLVPLRYALGLYVLFGTILAVYYARSIGGGLAGEDRAPGFQAPRALIAEILAPAAALIALTLFLSAPLGWLSPEVVTVGVEEVSSAFDGAAPAAAAPAASSPRLREIVRARQLPRDRTLGILLLLCFAAYYGPMAFALAAVNRRTLQVVNPVRVASRALRGGIAYFTIASVGVAVLFVFAVAALWLTPRAALALVLGALAYVCGVQGQLLGRLFAALPAQFLETSDSGD